MSDDSQRLRAIYDTVIDGILTIDKKGIIESANPAALRMFGYTIEELQGKNVALLMPNPYREEHDSYIENYLRTGVRRIIGIGREVVAVRKNGSVFPIDLAVSQVQTDEGLFFTGTVRDLTEREKNRREIQEQRDFAENLIETACAAVVVLDHTGHLARYNGFLESLSGRPRAEYLGKPFCDVFVTEEDRNSCQGMFQSLLAGGSVTSQVMGCLNAAGEELRIAWSARKLKTGDREPVGILAVGLDVTEQERARSRLLQSERLAAIGEMVTGIAHESRNALQRANACLEMMQLELAPASSQASLVDRALNALTELQRLYNEVQQYAAPIRLDSTELRLRDILEKVWNELKGPGIKADIELRIQETVPAIASVDRERMGQIFRNILDNAIHSCGDRGVIKVGIVPARLREAPAWNISIQDSGLGFSTMALHRVFDPFFTTKTKGTGLGMAITKRLVEAHQGTIQVGNRPSGGALVEIAIPR